MLPLARLFAVGMGVLALTACVQNQHPSLSHHTQPTTASAPTVSRIHYGNVLAVRPVQMATEANQPLLNAAFNGSPNQTQALIQAASTVLGSTQGNNNALIQAASQVLGGSQSGGNHALMNAVLSGLAANGGLNSTPTRGQEIVVQLENSHDAITVVETTDTPFRVGQRVRVLHGQNGIMRVLPIQ